MLGARGFLVGNASDPHVIRLMPPYNVPFDAVDAFCAAFVEAKDEVLAPA